MPLRVPRSSGMGAPACRPTQKFFPAPFASRFTSLHKNSIVEPHNVCAGFDQDEKARCKGTSGSRKRLCCRQNGH